MTARLRLGFVVGMAAEARVAARYSDLVEVGGGSPAGAGVAAVEVIKRGATALVSFGLAGGLDPKLRPGTVFVPAAVLSDRTRLLVDRSLAARFGGASDHTMLAGQHIVSDAAEKARLFAETGAHAVDLESGPVAHIAAAYGLPFAVVRAICDPAEQTLPEAALIALNPRGIIGFGGILGSVLGRPGQVPVLLALARNAGRARKSLISLAERFQAGVNRSKR